MQDSTQPNSKKSPITAAAVANEFLKLSYEEPIHISIDQMKLQKLLYYAHCWHLAIKDAPLLEEDFEAWPWGPVLKGIYYQTKKFGRNPITTELKGFVKSGDGASSFNLVAPDEISDPVTKDFIKQVWDVHKTFTGIQLSNSTHAPGEPWTIVKEKYNRSLETKPHIPNSLITEVFKKKLDNEQNKASTN